MYGMIHRGMRQMVIETAGEEAWRALERELGIGPAELISANVYDDELTVGLLVAVAERLGQSLPECMGAFGRYWVRFAERGSYGAIMDFVGNDFAGFIENLDRMHQAVVVAMPRAQVPSFALVKDDGDGLVVRYRSVRSGLEPFVIGLLEGLAARYGHAARVEQVPGPEGAADFRVVLEPAAAA